MPIEVTDVEEIEKLSAPPPAQELPREEETVPLVAAPQGRGRPPGSKDKQPQKRPAPADVLGEEEEEEDEPPPPRPVTRRSKAIPPQRKQSRRLRRPLARGATNSGRLIASRRPMRTEPT